MRLLDIYLKGYGGIYNGLGLKEISIDFTKCIHNMIVIKGDNGSGKSTIFNSLTPLPDPNETFIPGIEAIKRISYASGEFVYKLTFIHGVKTNGDRDTCKGYITRIDTNGGLIELNPNGNITSCKDIIFSELKLDSNFVSLSQLSSSKRGLADQKPAERKRFFSQIMSDVEVYNNINKIISKRASVFKSMINSIVSKIDAIGNDQTIKNMLCSTEASIVSLNNTRNSEVQNLATADSFIKQTDPDGTIQVKYSELKNRLIELNSQKNVTETSIRNQLIGLGLKADTDISKFSEFIKNRRLTVSQKIESLTEASSIILADREAEAKQLEQKTLKLQSLVSNGDYYNLKKSIEECQAKLYECEDIFSRIGIEDGSLLTKDEYVLGLNILKDIKDLVVQLREQYPPDIVEITVTDYLFNDVYPDYIGYVESRQRTVESLAELTAKLDMYSAMLPSLSALELRPLDCKNDSCKFIIDAVKAASMQPKQNIEELEVQIFALRDELAEFDSQISLNRSIGECLNSLKAIIRSINSNLPVINKLPIKNSFYDVKSFIARLLSSSSFDEIDILYSYLRYANIFEEYKANKETLYKLQSDMKVYESHNDAILGLTEDIDRLNAKISTLADSLKNNTDQIFEYNKELIELDKKDEILKTVVGLNKTYENIISDIDTVSSEVKRLEMAFLNIQNALASIDLSKSKIVEIDKSLAPLNERRDELKYNSKLLVDYKQEYEEYMAKYNKVETMRKYSSPTGGIQLVFIELYMISTIKLANELLGLLFNGRYTLMMPCINQDTFTLPCCDNNGFIHDDISSMSGGEIACISMIISFALLHQSSSILNILKLDEVDAVLDSNNRRNFIVVLEQVMQVMGCEQCVVISHNSELSLENSDVILLKDESTDPVSGNIIYQYR